MTTSNKQQGKRNQAYGQRNQVGKSRPPPAVGNAADDWSTESARDSRQAYHSGCGCSEVYGGPAIKNISVVQDAFIAANVSAPNTDASRNSRCTANDLTTPNNRFGFLCNGICSWLQTSSAPDREPIALSAWGVVQYAYV